VSFARRVQHEELPVVTLVQQLHALAEALADRGDSFRSAATATTWAGLHALAQTLMKEQVPFLLQRNLVNSEGTAALGSAIKAFDQTKSKSLSST